MPRLAGSIRKVECTTKSPLVTFGPHFPIDIRQTFEIHDKLGGDSGTIERIGLAIASPDRETLCSVIWEGTVDVLSMPRDLRAASLAMIEFFDETALSSSLLNDETPTYEVLGLSVRSVPVNVPGFSPAELPFAVRVGISRAAMERVNIYGLTLSFFLKGMRSFQTI